MSTDKWLNCRLRDLQAALLEKAHTVSLPVIKARDDHRPESYKIDVDSIVRLESIGPEHGWQRRLKTIEPFVVESPTALEVRRQNTRASLGCICPSRLISLDITPEKETEWTQAEKDKLVQEGLFDSEEVRTRPMLQKLPYAFHYRFECLVEGKPTIFRHMITDWEAGALYRRCVRSHGNKWMEPFRHKLEEEFQEKWLHLLMGTVHRFPDQWLIIGLIYPPKPAVQTQLPLAF